MSKPMLKYVSYKGEPYVVTSYSTERRLNGDTYYTLRSLCLSKELNYINSKDCTDIKSEDVVNILAPYVSSTKGQTVEGKGYEFGKLKEEPTQVTDEMIDKAIEQSVVYQEAIKQLRKQVAYGLTKYPEPLQASTWNFKESIQHALSENSDKQHYLSMMLLQAEYTYSISGVIGILFDIVKSVDSEAKARLFYTLLVEREKEMQQKLRPID